MSLTALSDDQIISRIKEWIQTFIIGLNICPFASSVIDKIIFSVHRENDPISITNNLMETIMNLRSDDLSETAFLITPSINWSFERYYEFSLIMQDEVDRRWPEEYVLVAFHPQFRFDGVDPEDTNNAVNRSFCPMIHILSKQSLDTLSSSHAANQITMVNKITLHQITWHKLHHQYGVPLSTSPP